MRPDTRLAAALFVLLTAHSVQAGPLKWPGKILQRAEERPSNTTTPHPIYSTINVPDLLATSTSASVVASIPDDSAQPSPTYTTAPGASDETNGFPRLSFILTTTIVPQEPTGSSKAASASTDLVESTITSETEKPSETSFSAPSVVSTASIVPKESFESSPHTPEPSTAPAVPSFPSFSDIETISIKPKEPTAILTPSGASSGDSQRPAPSQGNDNDPERGSSATLSSGTPTQGLSTPLESSAYASTFTDALSPSQTPSRPALSEPLMQSSLPASGGLQSTLDLGSLKPWPSAPSSTYAAGTSTEPAPSSGSSLNGSNTASKVKQTITFPSPDQTGVSSASSALDTTSKSGTAPAKTLETSASGVPTMISSDVPTGTSTVPASVYATNIAQAREYNDLFSKLTPESGCAAGQVACVQGQFAKCNGAGSFELTECATEKKCFALPMKTVEGVNLKCENEDVAKGLLEDGPGSTQPAVTETPTNGKPNVPVVTITTIITIDDGEDSGPTSQPVKETPASTTLSKPIDEQPPKETSVPPSSGLQPSSMPASDVPTTTSQPINEPPAKETVVVSSTTVVPSSSVEEKPTTATAPVVTTEAPVFQTTSSPSNAITTLTNTIKAPKEDLPASSADKDVPPTVTLVLVGQPSKPAGAAATGIALKDASGAKDKSAVTTAQPADGKDVVNVNHTVTVTATETETETKTETKTERELVTVTDKSVETKTIVISA